MIRNGGGKKKQWGFCKEKEGGPQTGGRKKGRERIFGMEKSKIFAVTGRCKKLGQKRKEVDGGSSTKRGKRGFKTSIVQKSLERGRACPAVRDSKFKTRNVSSCSPVFKNGLASNLGQARCFR